MKPTRKDEIKSALRRVERDKFDADGVEMQAPTAGTYRALEDFLSAIDETLFSFLAPEKGTGNIERIPDGTIIVDWRYNHKIILGVSLSENYFNFFYLPKKGVSVLGEANNFKDLLENKDFINAVYDLSIKFREKSAQIDIVGEINKLSVDFALS